MTIAATTVAAASIAWLLHVAPAVGALAFTGAMFVSVWLRNFGERARAAGAMIALPLAAILVAPAGANAPGGIVVDLGLVVAAGILAYVAVAASRWLAERSGSDTNPVAAIPQPVREARPDATLSVSTRLALQMTVALATAFAVGFMLFAGHWGWCVLTAFIVSSGVRSRGDAVYKGILRFGGAAVGTVIAELLSRLWQPRGSGEAIAIFAILFVGIALREVNYAYWAGCLTTVLGLLTSASADGAWLSVRLEAIVAGAACAILAAWYVAPIRLEAVIRRRLADALAALGDVAVSDETSDAQSAVRRAIFEHRMIELEAVAAPARWHRRIFARGNATAHPAEWIDLAGHIHLRARTLDGVRIEDKRRRAAVARAIGVSRRAIAEHGKPEPTAQAVSVSAALRQLHDTIASR